MVYSLAGVPTCFHRQLTVFSGNHCKYGGAWLGNSEEEVLSALKKCLVMQSYMHMPGFDFEHC